MFGIYTYFLMWYGLGAVVGFLVFRDARKFGRRVGEALAWGIASGLLLPFAALIYYFLTRRDWQKQSAGELPADDESANPVIRFLRSVSRNRGALVVLLLILLSVGANLYNHGWFCFSTGAADVDPLTLQWQSGTGACFDGEYLWVADDGGRAVRKIDPADAKTVAEVPIEGRAEGMAFDGKYLWVSVRTGSFPMGGHLVKINADSLKMTVYDRILTNPMDYGPLFYDGKYLWGGMDGISKICRTNGIVIDDYLVTHSPNYLVSDGRYLWSAQQAFYRIDPDSGNIIDSIGLVPGAVGGSLMFDGEDLWLYLGHHLYWLDLDVDGNPIAVTTTEMPVYGGNAVTDGSTIWMVDIEDATVIEFDIATREIVGSTAVSFADGTFAVRAALAYDGHDVWVVNRANGSVYKLVG